MLIFIIVKDNNNKYELSHIVFTVSYLVVYPISKQLQQNKMEHGKNGRSARKRKIKSNQNHHQYSANKNKIMNRMNMKKKAMRMKKIHLWFKEKFYIHQISNFMHLI